MIASCAVDVKFHDWETGECLGSVSCPDPKSKSFTDISWCNGGTHLAAVPVCGKTVIITPSIVSQTPPLPGKEEVWKTVKELVDVVGVKCVGFSKLENFNLMLGTVTGEVMLYNINSKKIVQNFMDLSVGVNMIECGAQDCFVAAGGQNGQIFIYGSGNVVSSSYFVARSDSLSKIAVHEKIPYLVAGGSAEGVISLWDVCSGSNILRSANHSGAVLGMAFSATDDSFTTIGADQKINIYDLRTSECVHEKEFDSSLTALAYCPNGTDLAVATGRGQIICLDKRYLHTCKSGLRAHQYPIKKITFGQASGFKYEFEKVSETVDYLEDELHSLDDLETPGSGDFSPNKSKVYQNLDKSSACTSRCQLGQTSDRKKFHIIEDDGLKRFNEEISSAIKDIINQIIETMNTEFLKMRMAVSREFCNIEIQNRKRWHDFNTILMKISYMDDQCDERSTIGKANSNASKIDTKVSKSHFGSGMSSKDFER